MFLRHTKAYCLTFVTLLLLFITFIKKNWYPKYWKPKHHRPQYHKDNVNRRRQNKFRDKKSWQKKDYITSLRYEKRLSDNRKKKLLPNIPTGNIIELDELIYAGEILFCDKIGVPLKNPNRNTKSGREIRFEGQIKKLRQQGKVLIKENIYWDKKTKTADLYINVTCRCEYSGCCWQID